MPNTSDLLSKVQQANLYFANLMDKYVDSFVYSLERDEKINAKVNDLYELLEAMDFQLAKDLYYDNENTKLIYQKIDCVTPIYNTYITIDVTLIKPFISNTIQSQAVWGAITGDINNQQDLIGLFSLKQNNITLTTTGTSGAATLIGATLNIPNYSPDLSGYVTLATTQTITGAKTFSNNIQTSSSSVIRLILSANAGENGLLNPVIGSNLYLSATDGTVTIKPKNGSPSTYTTFNNNGTATFSNSITSTSFIKTGGLSTQFLKADGSVDSIAYGTGSVTSVAALTLGTTGTDLSSTVANSTTTPVITLNVPTASAINRGALSSADWTTFNSKQDAGNYITSLTGEATATGPGAASVTLDNTAVIGKVLTGLNVTGGTVASTDSILQAFGKVQNQINGLIGGSIFQGVWDASTNTPALASGVGTNGYYYIVSVDGSTNLDGITDWKIGDWAIFAGTTWEKVDNTDAVGSVNGYTGTVSLVTGDVLEGAGTLPSRPSQLYFTDARARAAISLTTTGISGDSTYDNGTGVLNIPNYGSALTAYVPYSGATSDVNLGAFNITATSLIKAGGVDTQFLKADGSVDNNNYLTANDLPSTLSLYATNVAAAVAGYFKLVTTIDDPDYNTIAVDVPTGEITTTNQLIASLVSPVNLINGNPGVFNVTTTGNITRLSGSGEAEFFFRIYKRDSGGVETLVGTSGNTIPVINTGYSEFFATAIWNDGIFDVTDSIVLKYYANRIAGGSNPTYQFQFGGDQPVRTIVPIPTAVIPNIFLEQLADVEDGTEANNDGIFFDSSVSLWKYKSVSEVLGYTPANDASVVHLTGDETISDFKTFTNTVKITNGAANGLSLEIGTSGTYSSLKAATSGSSTNIILPSLSGTLALTSQLHDAVTLSAIGSTPNANGATLTGQVLNLQPASTSFGGVVTTGTQTFAGNKTFITSSSGDTVDIQNNGSGYGLRVRSGSAYFQDDVIIQGSLKSPFYTYTLPGATGTLALTSNITSAISGTTNYIPKFTGANTIGNSSLQTDTSGNLGLGVTPSAWWSGFNAIQYGTTGILASGSGVTNVGHNYFFNGSQSLYLITSNASLYQQTIGEHRFFTAPSGTAGNAITFTQAMTLGANGRLLLNTVSDAGDYILQANGNISSINSSAAGLFTISGTKSIRVQSFGGDWNYITSNGNPLVIRTEDNQSLYIRTNNTDRLTIDASTGAATFSSSVTGSGLIAKGTGSFNVNNNIRFQRGTGTEMGYIGWSDEGANNSTWLFKSSNGNPIAFSADGTNQNVFIGTDGNVGIGTTTPGAKLHVKETSSEIPFVIDSSSSSNPSYTQYRVNNSGGWEHGMSGVGDSYKYFFSYGSFGAANSKLAITSGGNVGIGTTTPGYQLQLSTDSAAKPTSALWTIASDERIKENISPYTKGLDVLMSINPVTYDYNGLGGFKKGKGGVGIIAQEIMNILPDSVNSVKGKLKETDKEEIDILNFNGHELTYVLINAIKELNAKIKQLENK